MDPEDEIRPIELTSSVPVPKRYAHLGKRRRSYTDEMFRCQITHMVSRTPLVCNALLWKTRIEALREHLLEHGQKVEDVQAMGDDQVRSCYQNAKRIFLEGIPEDCDDEDSEQAEEENLDGG